MQLPPPDAILSNVYKAFEECNPIKHFQNKYNTKHLQNKFLKHNLKAFTLAEVLIALVIIGIIAAITVPTLIQRYQDQALKSALKKNYSVLKSALDKYQVENGERFLPNEATRIGVKSTLMKYLNVLTDCGVGSKACIPFYSTETDTQKNPDTYKNYNGTSKITLSCFDDGQFVLNDGSLILIEHATDNSSTTYISVDVNGYAKKPNRLGKDLFMFHLTNKGELLPMGAKNTRFYSSSDSYCSNTSTNPMNGASCTAKVLRN